jgi:cyanophycinase-like exopeptidase
MIYFFFACFCLILAPSPALQAQGYRLFATGDTADVQTTPKSGLVLAGGGTDNDDAMRWMLRRADGGDVVVIRADGSDGYNSYFFSELGVKVNSVESIVITSQQGANDPNVVRKIRNAEALFIAGGDQSVYVFRWRGTALMEAVNELINEKKITVGGTSAGMAILGGVYYFPRYQGVISSEALANPYHRNTDSISTIPFLNVPLLKNVLTDTHFDQRNRSGRHFVMLARIEQDWNQRAFGISCNEQTAVCVDENGIGAVFSQNGAGENAAYFTQSNCAQPTTRPEQCVAGMPLTWNRGGQAVKAYKITGDGVGAGKFDLRAWKPIGGGMWEDWSAASGQFNRVGGSAPCVAATTSVRESALRPVRPVLRVRPNPAFSASHEMAAEISLAQPSFISLYVVNTLGQRVAMLFEGELLAGEHTFAIPSLFAGAYHCHIDIGRTEPHKETWMFVVAH